MLTVYVERGATFRELKELVRKRLVVLVHFPYDSGDRDFALGNWRQYLHRAKNSLVTCDTTQITVDCDILLSDMTGSLVYDRIRQIIGRTSEHDVRHLDAAYKTKADVFLTQDKGYILARTELEKLTELRIFHSDDDRAQFLEFVIKAHSVKGRP